MRVFFGLFLFIVFITMECSAVEPWAEKSSEAIYRQLELEAKLQELIDKTVDKHLQIKIGNISIIIDAFLKQRIVWKSTFP